MINRERADHSPVGVNEDPPGTKASTAVGVSATASSMHKVLLIMKGMVMFDVALSVHL